MKSFLVFVLCVTSALAMPQRYQREDFPFDSYIFFPDEYNNTKIPSTYAPSTTTAKAATDSRQYVQCFFACPSTPEYNPVCGSDGKKYDNIGRLLCAQRCGKDITMVRPAPCTLKKHLWEQ